MEMVGMAETEAESTPATMAAIVDKRMVSNRREVDHGQALDLLKKEGFS